MKTKIQLKMLIENIIKSELQEIQRGEKEGYSKIDQIERMKSYAKFGYVAHFGDLSDTGRFDNKRYVSKHKFDWKTPSGVYGYPIDLMLNDILNRNVPFAGNSPVIYILKVFQPENLLNLANYNDIDFEKDISKLKKIGFDEESLMKILVDYQDFRANEKIVYVTNILSDRNPQKWSKILRNLGYVGIYDPGFGIIHRNEKIQVVLFGPDKFEIVDKFKTRNESDETNDFPKETIKILAKNVENFKKKLRSINDEIKKYRFVDLALLEPDLNPEIITMIYQMKERSFNRFISQHPRTPLEILMDLANQEEKTTADFAFKDSMASNFKTRPEILLALSKNKDISIRYSVASNPKTPIEALINLSKDESEEVATVAKENPNFPNEK